MVIRLRKDLNESFKGINESIKGLGKTFKDFNEKDMDKVQSEIKYTLK